MNQKTGTIKDIVRRGQDILARMGKTMADDIRFREWYPSFGGLDQETYEHGMTATYPKSLGESCLEIAQEALLLAKERVPYMMDPGVAAFITSRVRGDIQQLKQAMYHRPRQIAGTPKGD